MFVLWLICEFNVYSKSLLISFECISFYLLRYISILSNFNFPFVSLLLFLAFFFSLNKSNARHRTINKCLTICISANLIILLEIKRTCVINITTMHRIFFKQKKNVSEKISLKSLSKVIVYLA